MTKKRLRLPNTKKFRANNGCDQKKKRMSARQPRRRKRKENEARDPQIASPPLTWSPASDKLEKARIETKQGKDKQEKPPQTGFNARNGKKKK